MSRTFRDAVLALAQHHAFARRLVNSGRLSVPTRARRLAAQHAGPRDAFAGAMVPGAPAADAPVAGPGSTWLLDYLRGGFTLLAFGDAVPADAAALARARADSVPRRAGGRRRRASPTSRIARRAISTADCSPTRYDGKPGTCYLFRPDQHVCARWRSFDADAVRAAIARATVQRLTETRRDGDTQHRTQPAGARRLLRGADRAASRPDRRAERAGQRQARSCCSPTTSATPQVLRAAMAAAREDVVPQGGRAMKHYIRFPRADGTHSRQAHADLPDGTFEREMGKEGFFGPAAHFHHRHPPTAWDELHRLAQSARLRPEQAAATGASPWDATPFMGNGDVRIRHWKTARAMDHLVRNQDGDELLFIHDGAGDFFCDWGRLDYRDGDYIVIPRGGMWRIEPSAPTTMLLRRMHRGHLHAAREGHPRPACDLRSGDPRRAGDGRARSARSRPTIRGRSSSSASASCRRSPIRSIRWTRSAGTATCASCASTSATSGR